MPRFRPVFFQTIFIGLITFYFTGEYVAYLTTAFLLVYIFFMSNKCIDLTALQSMVPLDKPLVIASKCACLDAPENTLGAAKEAIKKGVKSIHFQVRLTSDQIPIVYGHSLLESKTNGSGNVSDVTYDFLSLLNASIKDNHHTSFPNEMIPRLDDMITLCLSKRVLMVVELKGKPTDIVNVMKSRFERNTSLHKHLIAISEHPYLIYVLRKSIPSIMCGLIYRKNRMSETMDGKAISKGIYLDYFGYVLLDMLYDWCYKYWLWYVCGNSFIFAYRRHVSEYMVEYYLQLGVVIVVWPVNTDVEKEYFTAALRCPIMAETLSKEVVQTRGVSLDSEKAAEIQQLLVKENLRKTESINQKLNIQTPSKKGNK